MCRSPKNDSSQPVNGKHRHRRGHADVDADHAGFDAMLEFARGFAGVGEDRRAVAVGGFVGELDRVIEIFHAHDVEHRAEDFFARQRHLVLHLIDNRRANVKAVRRIGDLHAAAIGDDSSRLPFRRSRSNRAHDRDVAR